MSCGLNLTRRVVVTWGAGAAGGLPEAGELAGMQAAACAKVYER